MTITAKVIKASKNPQGQKIVTIETTYNRTVHCYDETTEVLARLPGEAPAYVKWPLITPQHELAAYSPGDRSIEFEVPSALHVQEDPDGIRMIHFRHGYHTQMVTEDHRVFFEISDEENALEPCTAAEFRESWKPRKQWGVYMSGQWYQPSTLTADELTLLAYLTVVPRFYNPESGLVRFMMGSSQQIGLLKDVLARIRPNWTTPKGIPSKAWACLYLPPNLRPFLHYTGSNDPLDWFMINSNLFSEINSSDRFRIFTQGLVDMILPPYPQGKGDKERLKLTWVPTPFAHQMMALASLNGFSFREVAGYDTPGFLEVKFYPEVLYIRRTNDVKYNMEIINTTTRSKVYCATVSTGALMLRRNNVPFVSGNSELMTYRMFCLAGDSVIHTRKENSINMRAMHGDETHFTIENLYAITEGNIPSTSPLHVKRLPTSEKLSQTFHVKAYYEVQDAIKVLSKAPYSIDPKTLDQVLTALGGIHGQHPEPVLTGGDLRKWYVDYRSQFHDMYNEQIRKLRSNIHNTEILSFDPMQMLRDPMLPRVEEVRFSGYEFLWTVRVDTPFKKEVWTIRATNTHRFYTPEGVAKPLSEFSVGDEVLVCDPSSHTLRNAKIKSLEQSREPLPVYDVAVTSRFENLVVNGFLVHNSRNAASSRAISLKTMRDAVRSNPAMPVYWGKDQKGMGASSELEPEAKAQAQAIYGEILEFLLQKHEALSNLGLAKQTTNRVLELFGHITVIITANEEAIMHMLYERLHHAAQPEFQVLAKEIEKVMKTVVYTPLKEGEWHLPYYFPEMDFPKVHQYIIDNGLSSEYYEILPARISAARCATVSYLTHDSQRPIDKELERYDNLATRQDLNLYGDPVDPMHACYDKDTEVLTDRGWVSWPNVSQDDLLAEVNPTDLGVEFKTPSKLHMFPYKGNMYHVSGQQLDLLVTPNHNMLVSRRDRHNLWTEPSLISADTILDSPVRYYKSGTLNERVGWKNPFDIDPVVFAKFVGFFVGDGSCPKEYPGNQAHFHLRKYRKIVYLRSLGLPMVESLTHEVVSLPRLGHWLRENCYTPDGVKKFPDGVLHLPANEVMGLLEGLRNSDGSTRRNTWIYATTSTPVLDMLQALLHLNGQVGSITETVRVSTEPSNMYRLNVSDRVHPRVEPRQQGRSLSYEVKWEAYEGFVYCASTTHGALLVRRGGHVVISGNSPLEHACRAESHDRYNGNIKGFTQLRKIVPYENALWRMI